MQLKLDLLHLNFYINLKSLGICTNFSHAIIILCGLLGISAIAIIEVKLYELSLVKFSYSQDIVRLMESSSVACKQSNISMKLQTCLFNLFLSNYFTLFSVYFNSYVYLHIINLHARFIIIIDDALKNF